MRFHCNCSRERLVSVLRLAQNPSDLLDDDADSLEATCEYCRETYVITRSEIVPPPETVATGGAAPKRWNCPKLRPEG